MAALVDVFMHEYHMSLEYVLDVLTVKQILALSKQINIRKANDNILRVRIQHSDPEELIKIFINQLGGYNDDESETDDDEPEEINENDMAGLNFRRIVKPKEE